MIELLVVIATITILAALLLPVLSKAKYSANNSMCRNNLRQLALALNAYSSLNHAFPPFYNSEADPYWNNALFHPYGVWWQLIDLPRPLVYGTNHYNVPLPYRKLGGVFQCPLNNGAVVTMEYGDGSGQPSGSTVETLFPSWTAFGYNAWGLGGEGYWPPYAFPMGLGGYWPTITTPSQSPVPTREASVVAPSDMIAFGDEFLRSRNAYLDGVMSRNSTIAPATHYGSLSSNPSKTAPKRQPAFIAHHGRANRAFVDGHVESEDMRRPFAATDAQLSRWMVDHQPHRDLLRD